jgi:hypothetical protein
MARTINPYPHSSIESQAHRFCTAETLTNSNRNAHKLQRERSQTRKVTRTSTPLPPLLHEISDSPVLLCKNTAHKQQQEHSQTATGTLTNIRTVNNRPPCPSPPRIVRLTGFVLQERSQIATRTLTNKRTVTRPYPPLPLSSTEFQTNGLCSARTLTNCNKNAHKNDQNVHPSLPSTKSQTHQLCSGSTGTYGTGNK